MSPTSADAGHPLSIPEIVLQPEFYSTLSAMSNDSEVDSTPTTAETSPAPSHAARSGTSLEEGDHVRHSPKTSIADLVLDNITYDAILASTTKGLHLDLNAKYLHASPSPLPSTDARAPPNTPASPDPGSLARATVMESSRYAGQHTRPQF